MKHKIPAFLTACCLTAALAVPAFAAEYEFSGADVGWFAEPTSVETVAVAGTEPANIDRSKTASLIPPTFGSPSSYVRGFGELMTPNLVNNAHTSIAQVTVDDAFGVEILPPASLAEEAVPISFSAGAADYGYTGYASSRFTEVTPELYYSSGELGTLSIPSLNLSVKVFQGTDNTALAKGAGHFSDTSIWDGNIAVAGHNRGVTNHFGQIHTLNAGDQITLATKLGMRSYDVCSVQKIGVNDGSILTESDRNMITLVTCVMNQPEYRWCVQAVESL